MRKTKGERGVGEEAGSNFAMQNPTDEGTSPLVLPRDIWGKKKPDAVSGLSLAGALDAEEARTCTRVSIK